MMTSFLSKGNRFHRRRVMELGVAIRKLGGRWMGVVLIGVLGVIMSVVISEVNADVVTVANNVGENVPEPTTIGFEECHIERHFVKNKEACTQYFNDFMAQFSACHDQAYYDAAKLSCDAEMGKVKKLRIRCLGIADPTKRSTMCGLYTSEAKAMKLRCKDPEYLLHNTKICENNDEYMIFVELDACGSGELTDSHCKAANKEMMQQLKACPNQLLPETRLRCHYGIPYMRAVQYACQTDKSYVKKQKGTCLGATVFTQGLELKCKKDTAFSNENRRLCNDNQLYYVMHRAARCFAEDHFGSNRDICEKYVRRSYSGQDMCDTHKFYKSHKGACQAGRHRIQEQRRSCVKDKHLKTPKNVCDFLEEITEEQHTKCQDPVYKSLHKKSCFNTTYFRFHYLLSRCFGKPYYDGHPVKCKDAIRKVTRGLVQKWSSDAYQTRYVVGSRLATICKARCAKALQ